MNSLHCHVMHLHNMIKKKKNYNTANDFVLNSVTLNKTITHLKVCLSDVIIAAAVQLLWGLSLKLFYLIYLLTHLLTAFTLSAAFP